MQTARTPQARGRRGWTLLGLLPLLLLTGCEGLSRSGNGALLGGAGGAVLGNAVAKAAGGSRTAGTAIGGILGAVGGAAVGDSMDQTERRARAEGAAQAVAARNAARAPTVDEVILMSQQGMREDLIINQIRTTGAVYQLTTSDLRLMQQGGVPSRVIAEMQSSSGARRVYTSAPVAVVQPTAVIVEEPRPSYGVIVEHRRGW